MTNTRKLIRADGVEMHLAERQSIDSVHKLIGANTLDTVMLRHMGHPLHVMLLNDLGYHLDLPVNRKATELYHANCRPGTTHEIRGDVVVLPDSDFAH